MSATGFSGTLVSAGSRVRVEAGSRSVLHDVATAAGVPALAPATAGTAYDVRLVLERSRQPFEPGSRLVTRGVSAAADGTTTIDDVGGSGYAQQWSCTGDELVVRTRWCPAPGALAARHLLRTRFRALRGQVLLHHPVCGGRRCAVWLHFTCRSSTSTGPPYCSRVPAGSASQVWSHAARGGGRAVCDNLAVSEGTTTFGLAEPLKLRAHPGSSGEGPAAPHAGRERTWPERGARVATELVVVLRRADAAHAHVSPMTTAAACREIVADTLHGRGEPRRWCVGGSLALATDRGPARPRSSRVAARPIQDLPCVEVGSGESGTASGMAPRPAGRAARLAGSGCMSDGERIEVAQVVTRPLHRGCRGRGAARRP